MIGVFQPTLGQEELDNVKHTFEIAWVGKGMKTEAFEYAWAERIGVKPEHVTSISCATEGLFQILEMVDYGTLGQGDEVIIPSIHFIGAANAVLNTGAKPVFCDVDPRTLNPTLEHIQAAYTRHTDAVIILHYGGVAHELDAIRKFCDDKGIWMIEDAAHAPATTYKGKAAGTWGHFGVFSFDAMKVISTGDGGMVYCESPEHTEAIRKRIYLGMDTESGLKSANERWWEFGVSCAGRRAIMNDIAAGIGLEQLKKLDGFIRRRVGIAMRYYKEIGKIVRHPGTWVNAEIGPSFYFYWIQTPQRDELARFLRDAGIYCTFRYYPLHWVFKTGQSLSGAEQAARETLLLPLHQGLTDDQVSYICEKVKEFYG